MKHQATFRNLVVATLAGLCLAGGAPGVLAESVEFSEAELFFELNNTDGDLGIHGSIDGGPWKWIRLRDHKNRSMTHIITRGRIRQQGLTQLFFESAEPTFDELDPADFFARFPEGTYKIDGRREDGARMKSETEITHLMPAPPDPKVNGVSGGTQCDDEEGGYNPPSVTSPILITWPAVTMSHPDGAGPGAGVQPPEPVEINNYEVVLEVETDSGFDSKIFVILPPEELEVSIPDEFIAQGDTFKFEVLAREESYNQTAVESCFEIAE